MTYPVPTGVPTSITLPEVRLLQHYAAAAGTVLEIGTLYGFSAIAMALAGAHVTTVDPHEPNDHDAKGSWERFLANCRWHGFDPAIIGGPIVAVRLGIEAVDFEHDATYVRWGMAFIDGDHAGKAPKRDARIALARLTAPGFVAFHDVTPNWPGVWRATQKLTASGELRRLDQVATLAVYQARDVAVP